MTHPAMHQLAEDLGPAGRRDLLRVLTLPDNVRADAIRQFHERGEEGMVGNLVGLEADELLREQVILIVRGLEGEAGA